jgi:hypothetical protein
MRSRKTWTIMLPFRPAIASGPSITLVLVVVGLLIASPLSADPITGFFNVHILDRISPNSPDGLPEPFNATIRLGVTFDDRIRNEFTFGDRTLDRSFGTPVFSTFPLPFAARPSGLSPSDFEIGDMTEYSKAPSDFGRWSQFGTIEHSEFATVGGSCCTGQIY